MTSNCIDVFNATTFKDFSSFSKRFTSVKDIINQDCCFSFNLTDDVAFFTSRIILSIINNSDWSIKIFSQATSTFNTRIFRANNDNVCTSQPFFVVVFSKKRDSKEIIHGDVKKALNLDSVKVKRQDTVDTSFNQHIGNQFSSDWFT